MYAGEQWDPDLGLYYNRARYLNVSTGRFWTQDKYEGRIRNPRSLHKYTYTYNNSINNIDPSGNFTAQELFLTGLFILGLVTLAVLSTNSVQVSKGKYKITKAVPRIPEPDYSRIPDFKIPPLPYSQSIGKPCDRYQFQPYIPKKELLRDPDYIYTSEDDAFRQLQAEYGAQIYRRGRAKATSGPCSLNSGYVPGDHLNVRQPGPNNSGEIPAAAIVSCECCDDSSGVAVIEEFFAIKNRRDSVKQKSGPGSKPNPEGPEDPSIKEFEKIFRDITETDE